MRARYDDDWYPGCDDFSDEDEPEVDEYNALNYDAALYPNESSLWPPTGTDESQCEEYDFGRPNNCPHLQYCGSGSSGRPAPRGLQTMIENLIYGTKVVIFSKTYCPYCITAKEIFDYMKQPYTAVELNRLAKGDQIQEIMGRITGGTSVPRVFVNGMFIGGGDDVKRLYQSGELEELLDLE